jgi:hypothetical protein
MTTEKLPWFVLERSELLAKLLLTDRPDVRILSRQDRDDGVDFVVGISGRGGLATPMFVARVRGTTTSDPQECVRATAALLPDNVPLAAWPTCLFVIDVRDNRAFYAWLAEPTVETGRPRLASVPTPAFQPLDAAALDHIIDRVSAWHTALRQMLQPA